MAETRFLGVWGDRDRVRNRVSSSNLCWLTKISAETRFLGVWGDRAADERHIAIRVVGDRYLSNYRIAMTEMDKIISRKRCWFSWFQINL